MCHKLTLHLLIPVDFSFWALSGAGHRVSRMPWLCDSSFVDEPCLVLFPPCPCAADCRIEVDWPLPLWKAEIVSRLGGDWDAAREHASRGLAAAPEYPNLLAEGVLLECESGQFLETETYLGKLRSSIRRTIDIGTTAMVMAAISRISKEFNYIESAQSMAQQVLESTTRTIETGRATTALALLAVVRGDVAVQHLATVRVDQRVRDPVHDPQRDPRCELPAGRLAKLDQVEAFHELHRGVDATASMAGGEDLHDVPV